MRKGHADSSGGQIHFRHIPRDGIATVFLHQTTSSGLMWERVMGLLAGHDPVYTKALRC